MDTNAKQSLYKGTQSSILLLQKSALYESYTGQVCYVFHKETSDHVETKFPYWASNQTK